MSWCERERGDRSGSCCGLDAGLVDAKDEDMEYSGLSREELGKIGFVKGEEETLSWFLILLHGIIV